MVSSNVAFWLYLPGGPELWYLVFWQNLVPNYWITLNNLAFLVHGINTVCHELLKKYNEKQMRKSSFTCKVRFSCKRNGTGSRNIRSDMNFLNLLLPLQEQWFSRGKYSLIYHCRIRIFVPIFICSQFTYLPLFLQLNLIQVTYYRITIWR